MWPNSRASISGVPSSLALSTTSAACTGRDSCDKARSDSRSSDFRLRLTKTAQTRFMNDDLLLKDHQRPSDNLIHVVILVIRQSSGEDDGAAELVRLGAILFEDGAVF